ncbi:MAG: OmpA family protein [Thiobacillus sp.]|nr:OmpA family protein [Thiobacillus sp.]
MFTGVASVEAAEGRFYDPSNAASSTGKTIGYELFRTIGCPGRELLGVPCKVVDSDGDGVPDFEDKCPDTPAGTKVDADGCPFPAAAAEPAPAAAPAPAALAPAAAPAPAPAPMMTVLAGVNFDFDQSYIRPDDFEKLDKDVATLKEWGDVKVEIAGHTDSVGTDEYNMGLSLRRAESVRTYLVDKGIPADRLTIRGYGESQPVADNATAEGRFQNRRVELIRQN